jgi:hypothetical protein
MDDHWLCAAGQFCLTAAGSSAALRAWTAFVAWRASALWSLHTLLDWLELVVHPELIELDIMAPPGLLWPLRDQSSAGCESGEKKIRSATGPHPGRT